MQRKSDSKAERELQHVLERRLSWWALPIRCDDISLELSDRETALHKHVCDSLIPILLLMPCPLTIDLPIQLAFQAGQLLILARQLRKTTEAFLNAPILKGLSEVVKNEVIQALPTLPPTPELLAGPVIRRQAQILAGPISTLQNRAQSLMLSVGTASVGLGSMLAANAFGQLIDGIALAGAVSLSIVWIAQGRWKHAKLKFEDDWKRCREALEGDLEVCRLFCLQEDVWV